MIFALCCSSLLFSQATEYQHKKDHHQKEVIGYFTNWDAWKAANHGVTKGFYNQLNIDYSQYTILNWSFLGVAKDGSLHSGDLRNKNIYQEGTVQDPGPMFYDDIYSSWDYWLLYGDLQIFQYLPDDLDQKNTHESYWAYEQYGYKGNGSGWINTKTGESGSFPLPLPKPGSNKGLLDLAHANNVKVMVSIGGWSMSKHFPDVAADPAKRARFVEDCSKLINMGFDGIDIDWEFPGVSGMNFQGTSHDYTNFAILMEEIRAAIGPDKLLTAAFGQTPNKLSGFDWNRLDQSMDYFNMMTYDFHGGWSNIAGHNAPLYSYDGEEYGPMSVDDTFQYLVSIGVNPQKINLGVGFYGRGVITNGNAALNAPTVKVNKTIQPDGPISTAGDYTNWGAFDATPMYNYIQQNKEGWTYNWDDQAKVPYLTKGNYFLSFDDQRSIEEKAKYVNAKNAGGVIIWQVFGDQKPGTITETIASKLPYAPSTEAPLVNTLNRVFAENGTPDNIPPTITLVKPESNTLFSQETLDTIAIEVTISDTDGLISSTEFTINSEIVSFSQSQNSFTLNYLPQSFGDYSLNITATDNDGATSSLSSTFKIEEKSIINNAPEFTGIQNTQITVGDSFNALDNITAQDIEDGDLTSSITIEGTVDTNTVGSYTLTYSVQDTQGLTTQAERVITVQSSTNGNNGLNDLISETMWAELFPNRYGQSTHITQSDTTDFYSYANFVEAVQRMQNIQITFERKCATNAYKITRKDKTTGATVVIREDDNFSSSSATIITQVVDYGSFLSEGNLETKKRELMAFLANISQETTGGWDTAPGGKYAWGLYFREEQGYAGSSSIGYVDSGSTLYPPTAGKSYHGRGPIQLSWNYNYGQVSQFLYGDKQILLDNPEKVIEDGALAFQTAIWFWMTPQYPKPSAHDSMVGNWQPTAQQRDAGLIPGFGSTVNIINGGIECNSGTENTKVLGRIGHYERYTTIAGIGMALDGSDNVVELGCANMPAFQIDYQECGSTPELAALDFINPKNGDFITLASGENVNIELNITDPNQSVSNIQITVDNQTFNGTTATWTPNGFGAYTLTATAKDGNTNLEKSITITLIDSDVATGCEGIASWSAQAYATPNTEVYYNGAIYKNKWYAEATDQPGSSDVWAFVDYCGEGPDLSTTCGYEEWDTNKVYATGGLQVYYQGNIYQSNWWTKGNIPSSTNEWSLVSSCPNTSARIATTEIFELPTFKVYPNPTSDILYIQTDKSVVKGMIYSLTGRPVQTFNSKQIQVHSLSSGTYLLKVIFSDGSSQSTKFSKK